MFSGIVQKMGTIQKLDLKEKWGRISLKINDWIPPVTAGESIAVQGICLTVTDRTADCLNFDVLCETFERTNLGIKKPGDKLNLERSLRWGETLGGHIVVGHVDGVGEVCKIRQVGRDWSYEFSCSQDLLSGIVYKGSVSIDGVSLTVAELKADSFLVHIIPFTWENTTFGALRVGDKVNLEVDLLSKYVRRLMERGCLPYDVSWDKLRAEGLIQ